ncbi:ABC transporter permease [Muricoccus radiodurans]|uniref:ABC transporter permease n=1 Tax=Muricoccus radiodurans TaxID=2231721 RepID=UPI003CFA967C
MTRLRLGLLLLGALALAALLSPWITAALGIDPEAQDLLARHAAPSPEHPLGTDDLGRDVLARLLSGARVSLAVGVAAALASTGIGLLAGVMAAWRGGWLDAAIMRLADGLLALPALPILVLLAAMDPGALGLPRGGAGTDIARIVVILALFGWMGVARLSRAAALTTLSRDHVRAARALGVTEGRLLWRHVVPSLTAPVAVAASLAVGGAILAESTLSFLGLGIQPPAASWGNMLANAQDLVLSAPGAAVWPGLCIALAVAGAMLVADGVRTRTGP